VKFTIGYVMQDPYTVKSEKPLPPGQQVFIVTELDAETVYYLAKTLAERGEAEKAFQVLREHEKAVSEKFFLPYSNAIVSPLLRLGQVEEALKIAERIEEDRDRDTAFARIAFYVFNKQGDLQGAKKIISQVRDEKRRAWGEFLLDLGFKLRQVRKEHASEELQRLLEVGGRD